MMGLLRSVLMSGRMLGPFIRHWFTKYFRLSEYSPVSGGYLWLQMAKPSSFN